MCMGRFFKIVGYAFVGVIVAFVVLAIIARSSMQGDGEMKVYDLKEMGIPFYESLDAPQTLRTKYTEKYLKSIIGKAIVGDKRSAVKVSALHLENSAYHRNLNNEGADKREMSKHLKVHFKFSEIAAAKGDVKSAYRLGLYYFTVNDFVKAKPYLDVSAKASDANSLLLLGLIYEYGLGVEKDASKGELYKKMSGDKVPLKFRADMELTAKKASTNPTVIQSGGVKKYWDANRKLTCEDFSSLKPTDAPPALFNAMIDCAKKGEMKKSALYYLLARGYGSYDMMRVTDKTAHQSIPLLFSAATKRLSDEENRGLLRELNFLKGDGRELSCSFLSMSGAPTYSPEYMVLHGTVSVMKAMGIKKAEGEIEVIEFESPKRVWGKVLQDHLSCGVVS